MDGTEGDIKFPPFSVQFFFLRELPTYFGGTNGLILEWLRIGGLPCLDWGDAPVCSVENARPRCSMRSRRRGARDHVKSMAPYMASLTNLNFNI